MSVSKIIYAGATTLLLALFIVAFINTSSVKNDPEHSYSSENVSIIKRVISAESKAN